MASEGTYYGTVPPLHQVYKFLAVFTIQHSLSTSMAYRTLCDLQVRFSYMVRTGDVSTNLTWAGASALGANGAGDGGEEDWILRRSTNPRTLADVTLPYPSHPLATGGSTICVNTTGRPKVLRSSICTWICPLTRRRAEMKRETVFSARSHGNCRVVLGSHQHELSIASSYHYSTGGTLAPARVI